MKKCALQILKYTLIILSLVGLNGSVNLKAQNHLEAYQFKTKIEDKDTLNYRILYPVKFDSLKTYPLVLFLHGMGERGRNNKSQMAHGSKLFFDSLARYPAVVIYPQCPPSDYWANLNREKFDGGGMRMFFFHTDQGPNTTLKLVISLLGEFKSKPYIDTSRIYLSGLSMGAMGVWELLWRMPETFAAAAPICGGGPPEKAKEISKTPLWVFHGLDDTVVHPRYSLRILRAVQKSGGRAKISLYPGVNHNAWDHAFTEPDFLSWLFSHEKK